MQASQWTKHSPGALELLLARTSPTTHPQGRAWGGTGAAWGGPTDMYCVLPIHVMVMVSSLANLHNKQLYG